MALYGDLTFDSRVQREAAALADLGFDVTIACLDGSHVSSALPGAVRIRILRPTATSILPGSDSPFLALEPGRFGALMARVGWLTGYIRNLRSWGKLVVSGSGPVDVWHAHDLTALVSVAPVVGRTTPIVYDAHELFLETGSSLRLPGLIRILLREYERRLVRRAVAVVTVNDQIARVLQRRYRPARIVAVHNCPGRWTPPTDAPDLLRRAVAARPDEPVVLYHGALSANRGIEQLIAALHEPGLERVRLVLLGYGELRDHYITIAADRRHAGRLHVLEPVRPADLLDWIASADVGAMPIQPSTLNHRLSTPNKLFECLAAGVPVVASAFPAMREIIENDQNGALGVTCDPTDVRQVAAAIRSILQLDPVARRALRDRCLLAARDRWNWETQSAGLCALYTELVAGGDCSGAVRIPFVDSVPADQRHPF